MKRIVIKGPNNLQVEEVSRPKLIEGHAIVAPLYTGLCGSDIQYFSGQYSAAEYPGVRGHECVGRIVKINKECKDLSVGDLVIIQPNIPCGRCFYCLNNRTWLCDNLKVLGASRLPGTMQELVSVPCCNLYPVSNSCNPEQAVLTEPFSIALHAAQFIDECRNILSIGAGGVGLLGLLYLLKIEKSVEVMEINDHVIKTLKDKLHIDALSYADLINKSGRNEKYFDAVIINCGLTKDVFNLALRMLQKGGRIILVGLPREDIIVDFQALLKKEAAMFTSFKDSPEDFQKAVDFITLNSDFLMEIMTFKIFNFERALEAFQFKLEHNEYKVLIKN